MTQYHAVLECVFGTDSHMQSHSKHTYLHTQERETFKRACSNCFSPTADPSLLVTLTPSGRPMMGALSLNILTGISNTPADSAIEYDVSSKPTFKSTCGIEYCSPPFSTTVHALTVTINDENGYSCV